jgi:alkylation response protein AidB-like acyl-CoA dehydrogenase
MRDARINTIGEGANEVLKAFVAVVGSRGPGVYLKALQDDMLGFRWSLRNIGASLGVLTKMYLPWATSGAPDVPVKAAELQDAAATLGTLVRQFGLKLPHVFKAAGDEATFAVSQLVHERIADIAIDLYAATCVLSRLDHLLEKPAANGKTAKKPDPYADVSAGLYFLKLAFRRIRERFAALDDNDDPALLDAAKSVLGKF